MTDAQKKKCLQVLSEAEIFSSAGILELDTVLDSFSSIRDFPKNAVIYSRDSREKCIGILLSGEARVMKEHVTLSVLRRGGHFGAVVLYNDADRFVNTILAKTECTVLFLQKEGVDRLMAHNRHFAESYIAYLSRRIYFLNAKIEAYTAPAGEERLLGYLHGLCDADGVVSGVSITEISRQINVSRAGIYRALDHLSAQGKLRYADRKIQLL